MTWAEFLIQFFQWWGTITFGVASVFVLGYGLGSPWYLTPFGRSLIILDAGVAVATLPTFLDFVFHIDLMDNRIMGAIVVVASAAVTLAIAYRIVILYTIRHKTFWRAFREDRAKRAKDKS